MSVGALKKYLDITGILSCNVNPYLPALSDIQCEWDDMTKLLDRHQLFHCKSYRKRTTYLSPEVYYLLKAVKPQRPMDHDAKQLYRILEQTPGLESGELRQLSQLNQQAFVKAMDLLLEERYVTALQNGTYLNPNWSTFRYGTATAWEAYTPAPAPVVNPRQRLVTILERTLAEDEVWSFIG